MFDIHLFKDVDCFVVRCVVKCDELGARRPAPDSLFTFGVRCGLLCTRAVAMFHFVRRPRAGRQQRMPLRASYHPFK